MVDAGDFQPFAHEAFGQIKTGRVAFHIRAQRDHYLPNRLLAESFFQFADAEVLRLDTTQWRNFSAEHVILAPEGARLFQTDDIHWPFDNAKERGVATWISAEVTRGFLGERTAHVAEADALARPEQVIR